jgi:hypothetical protein
MDMDMDMLKFHGSYPWRALDETTIELESCQNCVYLRLHSAVIRASSVCLQLSWWSPLHGSLEWIGVDLDETPSDYRLYHHH